VVERLSSLAPVLPGRSPQGRRTGNEAILGRLPREGVTCPIRRSGAGPVAAWPTCRSSPGPTDPGAVGLRCPRLRIVDPMRVIGLDHVVVICRDPDASLEFYSGILGLEALEVGAWRRGEAPFPSVRVDESTIIDLLPGLPDGRNTDHVCLLIEPTDLHELAGRPELNVVEGPVQRGGARGSGWSIYVMDPDGHLLELKHYGQAADGHSD
jgi:catechol 2,3-dioxygenase-like lactoylglutathione lyase family enzyme